MLRIEKTPFHHIRIFRPFFPGTFPESSPENEYTLTLKSGNQSSEKWIHEAKG